jgi:ABC-2 type transport system permease protein
MNRWNAFTQLVLTRFREFYREPEVVFWVYGFPLILAIGLGIAFSGGKLPPPTVDIQGSEQDSRVAKLKEILQAEEMKVEVHSRQECRERLKRGKTDLYIVPEDKHLRYVYDDTRKESVMARHWVESVWVRSQRGASVPKSKNDPQEERGSRYIDFLVPGLMGMNIMGGGLFGIGFVLVDMRVRKLFKRFLATPMNRVDFLLALFTARTAFLIPEMLALFAVGWFLFGVPVEGNPLTLLLVILLSAFMFSALGLLIGSRTEKMESASGLINLFMLPQYLFSGVFFSSRRFPEEVQPFIQALPLTQVNDALREVMLEGRTLPDIAWRLAIIAAWTVVPMYLALKWFRWR